MGSAVLLVQFGRLAALLLRARGGGGGRAITIMLIKFIWKVGENWRRWKNRRTLEKNQILINSNDSSNAHLVGTFRRPPHHNWIQKKNPTVIQTNKKALHCDLNLSLDLEANLSLQLIKIYNLFYPYFKPQIHTIWSLSGNHNPWNFWSFLEILRLLTFGSISLV